MEVPDGLDWEIMRIVTSERFSVDAVRIREHWTMEDLVDAHIVEDMFDDAERKAAKRAQ